MSRSEALAVFVVVLAGLGLRALNPGAMAVEHFDEGVYASNLYCGHLDPPFAYPMRHLYAPPLFPALLEWAQIFAGPSAVMWVNVLLGSLMVAAIWWTTRDWFGSSAGVAAAVLAAASEYHIAFSRMALTDVPLSLFMLLGVYAGWKAILTGRPLWIGTAGVLAGIAWCTKYNGWLTLAVTGSGAAAALLVPKLLLGNALTAKLLLGAGAMTQDDSSRRPKTIANCTRPSWPLSRPVQIADCKLSVGAIVFRWGVMAGVAAGMFWWFVVRELAPLGGYAAVAENHAGYFVGFGGWWTGFLRQAEAHDWLMGWPTAIGIAIAWMLSASLIPRDGGKRADVVRGIVLLAIGILLAVASRFLTASGLLAIAALAGFVCVLRRTGVDLDGSDGRTPGAHVAAWLLLAWFFGLLVSVPLYYPYPRLSLPWVVATWPLAGAAFAAASRWLRVVRGNGTDRSSAAMTPEPPLPTRAGRSAGNLPQSADPVKRLTSALLTTAVIVFAWLLLDRLYGPNEARQRPIHWGPAWQSRDYVHTEVTPVILSEIAPAVVDPSTADPDDLEAVVYVAGNPAMFFQLSAACRSPGVVLQPVADFEGLRPTPDVRTYLVTQTANRAPRPQSAHLVMRQSYMFPPSTMVLLDQVPASRLRTFDPSLNEAVRLYRIVE